jgi:hypothetical protein
MYFIRIEPLKERLRERAMTDREALPYYAIFMACTTMLGALPMASQSLTRWDALLAFTGALLTITGVIYSYARNGGRTGYDLIQKSIVLGWVLIIRLLALFIPVAIGVGFLKTSMGQSIDETSWVDVLLVAIFEVIYFQRLGRHLEDTDRRDGEQRPEPHRCPANVATSG